jgi:hypothetical protein
MHNAKKTISPIVQPLAHPNTQKELQKKLFYYFLGIYFKITFFLKKGCRAGGVFTCSSERVKAAKIRLSSRCLSQTTHASAQQILSPFNPLNPDTSFGVSPYTRGVFAGLIKKHHYFKSNGPILII